MAKLNKKRCAVIAGAMLIAAVLAADYAGLFGKVLGCGSKETRTHVVGDLKGDTVIELAPVEPGEMP